MKNQTTLRLWDSLIGVVAACVLVLGIVHGAEAQKDPIKIGGLNAITGPLAVNGSEINEGIKLYWEDEMSNQVAGRAEADGVVKAVR
jgi:hypothetical protein